MNKPGTQARKQGAPQPTVYQQYRLQQSFWVEALPLDPKIKETSSNAAIVGLIQGNRPLPSGFTVYSKRR